MFVEELEEVQSKDQLIEKIRNQLELNDGQQQIDVMEPLISLGNNFMLNEGYSTYFSGNNITRTTRVVARAILDIAETSFGINLQNDQMANYSGLHTDELLNAVIGLQLFTNYQQLEDNNNVVDLITNTILRDKGIRITELPQAITINQMCALNSALMAPDIRSDNVREKTFSELVTKGSPALISDEPKEQPEVYNTIFTKVNWG